MKIKRIAAAVTGVLLLGAVAASCGSDSKTETPEAPAPTVKARPTVVSQYCQPNGSGRVGAGVEPGTLMLVWSDGHTSPGGFC